MPPIFHELDSLRFCLFFLEPQNVDAEIEAEMARIRTTAASSSSSSSSSLLSHDHDRTNDDDDGSDAALRRRATAFVDAAHAEAVQVPSLGQSVRIFSRNPTQDTHELGLLEIPHGHTLFLTRLFLMHHLPTPSIHPPASACTV